MLDCFFVEVFEYQYGMMNFFRVLVGLEKINALAGGNITIWYAVFPQTWQNIGLMFIIAYTGFSTMSRDYLDAALLEGLSSFQRLTQLYIPVCWDSISTCFIIALVGPLKAFEHIWIITNGGGGDQKTHIPSTLMYRLGFDSYEYGYGSAIGTFICLLAIILVAKRKLKIIRIDFFMEFRDKFFCKYTKIINFEFYILS